MSRVDKWTMLGPSAVLLTGFLVCCVNYTTRVQFSFLSCCGETKLSLSMYRPEVMFTPNANNVDEYDFSFPTGLSYIAPSQIHDYADWRHPQAIRFAESGGIDLKIDADGCEVRIELTTVDGHALAANGTYREAHCGADKI